MNEKLLNQKAEEYLESEAKPYSLSSCTLCDVKNWGGKESKDRYYSEPKVIGFLTKFAQQETDHLSQHILELQATNGSLTDRVDEAREIIKTSLGLLSLFSSSNGSVENFINKAEQFLKG